jgi:hypothetical protein
VTRTDLAVLFSATPCALLPRAVADAESKVIGNRISIGKTMDGARCTADKTNRRGSSDSATGDHPTYPALHRP